MTKYSTEEDGVYITIRWGPVAIASNNDYGEEHEGESIYQDCQDHEGGGSSDENLQSMEHKPPTSPKVLL